MEPSSEARSERKGHKRKQSETESSSDSFSGGKDVASVLTFARHHLNVLSSHTSWNAADRSTARCTLRALAELAKLREDTVDILVNEGAVAILVQHLDAPLVPDGECVALEHEIEKEAAFVLGLLAVKPDYQQQIADAGALSSLIGLLKRFGNHSNERAVNGVIRRAAETITNLAHENGSIKNLVRVEGGIPPLVDLLDSNDPKVQRAAAGALRTLAFKNESNKNMIVSCNALPHLILMLQSEAVSIHSEAVGVIGNLVHSSANIKREVIKAGALQPVIGLLSSKCSDSQKEAALLLGQFATVDSECKLHIAQRGAIRPLIKMLQSSDPQLMGMAAFALGRLAQDLHNQAGIVHAGGLPPLLELVVSKNSSLQHHAAFTLCGLAENTDNAYDIIKCGVVERLQNCEMILPASKECAGKFFRRLQERINGRVLKHLLYLMRLPDKVVQRRIVTALAHLCCLDDQRMIFIDHNGLDLLLGLLSPNSSLEHQQNAANAMFTLAKKALELSPIDAVQQPPIPQVYLGEKFVNNETLSDVHFIVEGKCFYAHRIALLASSDAFRAMFDGGYKEKEAKNIEIPNICWKVFDLMMRFIYTGTAEVTLDVAQDLLRASDQYLLEPLKRLCEECIAEHLRLENISEAFELAEDYQALHLRNKCLLFILEHYQQLCGLSGFAELAGRIIPPLRDFMCQILRPLPPVS